MRKVSLGITHHIATTQNDKKRISAEQNKTETNHRMPMKVMRQKKGKKVEMKTLGDIAQKSVKMRQSKKPNEAEGK